MDSFPTWSIAAVNLPEHADNPVHTDAGGRAAGYTGAVVAGTTVLAYLTRPVAAAWGHEWVTNGGYDVWFRGPVLADELVTVSGGPEAGVTARVDDRHCARLAPVAHAEPPPPPQGTRLDPTVVVLDERWTTYAERAGEDLSLYAEANLVHPVVWPSLANRVFAQQLVTGSWIHTRSAVRHLGTPRPVDSAVVRPRPVDSAVVRPRSGDTVVIEAWEIDRFETRAGDRAVVDLRMTVDDIEVCAVEHEAVVRLAE
ncbi:MAG: hypothetical protein AAGA37_14610 [Actinomycetota bacterium]